MMDKDGDPWEIRMPAFGQKHVDFDRENMLKDMELVIYEHEEESDDGNPYCECNEQPYEEEAASNICSACGKLLS